MTTKQADLNKHCKELATFGYIRSHSVHTVPVAINKLCLQYFDEIFYITLRGKELKKFWKLDSGQYIERSFKYNNDISFECKIYPNEYIDEEQGFVVFGAFAEFDETKILKVIGQISLQCPQTNTKFRVPVQAQSTWSLGSMRLSECGNFENIKQLLFTVYVDIHCVEYKGEENWYKPLKMHKNISFEWNIDRELLEQFKKCEWGKYYESNTFDDDCWELRFCPNGDDLEHKGKCVLFVSLLRFPSKIKEIGINWKVKKLINDDEEYKYERHQCFDFQHYSWLIEWDNDTLKTADSLQFAVEIEITKFINDNDEIILPEKWKDLYDFIIM